MNQPESTEATAPRSGPMRLVALARRVVEAPGFEYFIIAVILANAVVLGLGTSPTLERRYGDWFETGNTSPWESSSSKPCSRCLPWPQIPSLFPRRVEHLRLPGDRRLPYPGDRRVRHDHPPGPPAEGGAPDIDRQDLRLIVAALVRSIPSVIHVMLLMSIVVYIYAIMGYHLFHEHDPENWRSLGISVLTLFNIITLEGWTLVMYKAMEAHPWAWLYFVSFIIAGTFVVINLFVAIIINNLEEAKADRLRELAVPPSRDELLREIRATQAALQRLEKRLDGDDGEPGEGRR